MLSFIIELAAFSCTHHKIYYYYFCIPMGKMNWRNTSGTNKKLGGRCCVLWRSLCSEQRTMAKSPYDDNQPESHLFLIINDITWFVYLHGLDFKVIWHIMCFIVEKNIKTHRNKIEIYLNRKIFEGKSPFLLNKCKKNSLSVWFMLIMWFTFCHQFPVRHDTLFIYLSIFFTKWFCSL